MKKSLFIGCSLSALALAIGSAAAQTQTAVETVTVTGVIGAVQGALNIKQNSGQMVDAIVAEDIGKLPDTTVVESLQHVTGIAILRTNNEPSTVLIRGLPDIQTLVNGREIFTSTGRALSLPDIPSELLASVSVAKTSTSTDLEGGIAGVIDVRLHRPFDFKGAELAVGGQLVTESLAKHIDPNVSMLASNRWNTDIGEVGLLLDVAYKDTHTRSDQMNNQSPYFNALLGPGIPNVGSGPLPLCTRVTPACTVPEPSGGAVATNAAGYTGGVLNGNGLPATGGYAADTLNTTLYETLGHIERASMVLSSQWKPTQGVQVYAEGFYTRQRSVQPVMVDVVLNYVCPDTAKTTVYPGTNIVSQSVSGCFSLTSMQDRHTNEDTFQFASGFDWAVNSNFEVTSEIDVTVSKGVSQAIILDDTYNLPPDGLTITNNYQGTAAHYVTQVGNPQFGASGQFVDQLFDNRTISKGSEWDWRVDGTYNFSPDSFIKDFVVGFRITSRGANNQGYNIGSLNCVTNPNPSSFYNAFIIAAANGPACGSPNGYDYAGSGVAVGAPAFTSSTTPQTKALYFTHIGGLSLAALAPNNAAAQDTSGLWFGGKFGMNGWTNMSPDWGWQNMPALRAAFGYANVPASGQINAGNYTVSGPPNNPGVLFIVLETSKSAYLKADYGFNVLGFPVDGNLGFRFTDYTLTEQANNSVVSTDPVTKLSSLTFVPTIGTHETSIFLPSWNAKVTLDDGLFVRFAASETATRPTFSQLNPATNYNLGGTTLQSTANSGNPNLAAVKSINLDTDVEYYWGKANHVAIAGFHRYVEGYIQNQTSQVTQGGVLYNFTQPVNFQNSYIDGAEAGYSQFLDFLPDFWSGFGWDVNATYISGVFNNISKWHYNMAGIYEYEGVSVRVSYTWSGSYKINPQLTSGLSPNTQWGAPRGNLDASINYKWNDQLTFTLDATNLNDGKYKAYDGANAATGLQYYNMNYQRFDHTLSVGVRYRM